MNSKLLASVLLVTTLVGILAYPHRYSFAIPSIIKQAPVISPTQNPAHTIADKNIIDVVFVLDTTGSMGGLIQAAKEKIWSIASTMASAQNAPVVRIGLVAYRDRGDAYVTKVVDLSDDLDSVYASLMDFQAGGGGDTPESVNKGLHDAVYRVSWNQKSTA
mgnify:CR=1 FL=1